MTELRTTTEIVKGILEDNEKARNSDSLLYLEVLRNHAAKQGINLGCLSVPFFLTAYEKLGFPGFETVRRTRQKVQATFPHLASNKRVAEFRAENEQKFKAYAVGDIECN